MDQSWQPAESPSAAPAWGHYTDIASSPDFGPGSFEDFSVLAERAAKRKEEQARNAASGATAPGEEGVPTTEVEAARSAHQTPPRTSYATPPPPVAAPARKSPAVVPPPLHQARLEGVLTTPSRPSSLLAKREVASADRVVRRTKGGSEGMRPAVARSDRKGKGMKSSKSCPELGWLARPLASLPPVDLGSSALLGPDGHMKDSVALPKRATPTKKARRRRIPPTIASSSAVAGARGARRTGRASMDGKTVRFGAPPGRNEGRAPNSHGHRGVGGAGSKPPMGMLSPSCPDLATLGKMHEQAQRKLMQAEPRTPKLSLSEAKQALFTHRIRGMLVKQGFGGFRRWVPRYVSLCGRVLSYYANYAARHGEPRGQVELTKATRIRLVEFGKDAGRRYGFEVQVVPDPEPTDPNESTTDLLGPNAAGGGGGGAGDGFGESKVRADADLDAAWMSSDRSKWPPPWRLCAKTAEQRSLWLLALTRSIRLIERVTEPATLRGLGSVYHHFEIGVVLGKGRFGIVRECAHRQTGKKYAIKCVNKTKNITARGIAADRTLRNELRVLRRIRQHIGQNPYICGTYEVYEDSFMTYIVMEYLGGGDLFDRIVKRGKYTEKLAAEVTRQLVLGVQVLHREGIVHRDMKPENVLFATHDDLTVKIADFGCALIKSKRKTLRAMDRVLIGTPGYIAPEVLAECNYSSACDVWALGVILYIVLVGYPPFYGKNDWEIFERTKRGKYSFHSGDWKGVSNDAKDLVRRMLTVNPKKRITTRAIMKHNWIVGPPSEASLQPALMRLTSLDARRKLKKEKMKIKAAEEKVKRQKQKLKDERERADSEMQEQPASAGRGSRKAEDVLRVDGNGHAHVPRTTTVCSGTATSSQVSSMPQPAGQAAAFSDAGACSPSAASLASPIGEVGGNGGSSASHGRGDGAQQKMAIPSRSQPIGLPPRRNETKQNSTKHKHTNSAPDTRSLGLPTGSPRSRFEQHWTPGSLTFSEREISEIRQQGSSKRAIPPRKKSQQDMRTGAAGHRAKSASEELVRKENRTISA